MKSAADWDRIWDEAFELIEQDKRDADEAQLALLDEQPDKEDDDE